MPDSISASSGSSPSHCTAKAQAAPDLRPPMQLDSRISMGMGDFTSTEANLWLHIVVRVGPRVR